jgi:flagellar biosynthesis chaperone FliJ
MLIQKRSSELGINLEDFYQFIHNAIDDERNLQQLKSKIVSTDSFVKMEIKLTKYETLLVMLENETC